MIGYETNQQVGPHGIGVALPFEIHAASIVHNRFMVSLTIGLCTSPGASAGCCVQLRKGKAMMMDEVNVEFGYVYGDPETRIEMVEFHVDYCHGVLG